MNMETALSIIEATLRSLPVVRQLSIEADIITLDFLAHQETDSSTPLLILNEFDLPDRWIPHCTLAGHLISQELPTAVEVCQRNWTPIVGYVSGIGMRVLPSITDHSFFPFRDC